MPKELHIKTASADSLAARRAQGESQTDLARVCVKSEEDLEHDIADDPDCRDIAEDWYLHAKLVLPEAKKLLSLRLDGDVLDWFKHQGPGYQTRINAVLRAFMQASERNIS